MKREDLRKVKCKYLAEVTERLNDNTTYTDKVFKEAEGYFHEWNGAKAIIELEDGTIIQTPYWFVQFIS
ncbi:MAG: hypothetical protein SPF04_01830 [Bacilli bacterium]|nr:hypothetical protein [Candidatus Onthovivens sp.]MDY5058202.1 hypothetical protein [Bacilli bacterium]